MLACDEERERLAGDVVPLEPGAVPWWWGAGMGYAEVETVRWRLAAALGDGARAGLRTAGDSGPSGCVKTGIIRRGTKWTPPSSPSLPSRLPRAPATRDARAATPSESVRGNAGNEGARTGAACSATHGGSGRTGLGE